jgi:hypothetical protein
MNVENDQHFNDIIKQVGNRIKELRILSGYKSYEVFAWENELSRIQYWKMEQGTNCTLKSLNKILQIHTITFQDFFNSLDQSDRVEL